MNITVSKLNFLGFCLNPSFESIGIFLFNRFLVQGNNYEGGLDLLFLMYKIPFKFLEILNDL